MGTKYAIRIKVSAVSHPTAPQYVLERGYIDHYTNSWWEMMNYKWSFKGKIIFITRHFYTN